MRWHWKDLSMPGEVPNGGESAHSSANLDNPLCTRHRPGTWCSKVLVLRVGDEAVEVVIRDVSSNESHLYEEAV